MQTTDKKEINGIKQIGKQKFKLAGAKLNGYEYTKTYYKMQDGKIVVTDKGDDSALTMINITKINADPKKEKRAFIASEGYIGADKSYNEDGTKKKSVSHKKGFGISFLMDYIGNAPENIDEFHVMFLSDKEKSENQADLFAQAIKDIGNRDDIKSVNMWCHSKSGLLSLRAFQKLKAEQNIDTDKVLNKVSAVLTSMPAKGIEGTDRNAIIEKMNENGLLKIMPFAGYIKTGILSFYDKFLYKPCPAQVDIKKSKENKSEKGLIEYKPKGMLGKIWDKIQGNDAFQKRVSMEKQVDYDAGYLDRVTNEENMASIKDVKYKTLPIDLTTEAAFSSLLREGQVMPLVLSLKKAVTSKGQKGDGIIDYESQGIGDKSFEERLKVDKNKIIKASHDVATTEKGGMEIIAKELNDGER